MFKVIEDQADSCFVLCIPVWPSSKITILKTYARKILFHNFIIIFLVCVDLSIFLYLDLEAQENICFALFDIPLLVSLSSVCIL